METATLLKKAWEVVVESGVPEHMQDAAFKAAIDQLSSAPGGGGSPPPPVADEGTPGPRKAAAAKKRTTAMKQSASSNGGSSPDAVVKQMPDEDEFFAAVSKETGVSEQDLCDVFHVADGELQLKVAGKDLGDNNKAATMTVVALLAGAVFAGTDHKSLPISEVHDVCRTKRCHGETNASKYVKATPNFASIGNGPSSALTHKSGWQGEFARAVAVALGKSEDGDG